MVATQPSGFLALYFFTAAAWQSALIFTRRRCEITKCISPCRWWARPLVGGKRLLQSSTAASKGMLSRLWQKSKKSTCDVRQQRVSLNSAPSAQRCRSLECWKASEATGCILHRFMGGKS